MCFVPIFRFVFLELGLHSIEREKFLKGAPIEKVNKDKQVVSFSGNDSQRRPRSVVDDD